MILYRFKSIGYNQGTTKVQLSLKMLWFCHPFNQQWLKTWWKQRHASPMGMTDAKFCFKYTLCVCSQAVLHAAFCSGSCMLQPTTRFRYIVCLCIVLLWLLWRRARLLAAWSVFVTDRSLDTAVEGAGHCRSTAVCRGEVCHTPTSAAVPHTLLHSFWCFAVVTKSMRGIYLGTWMKHYDSLHAYKCLAPVASSRQSVSLTLLPYLPITLASWSWNNGKEIPR